MNRAELIAASGMAAEQAKLDVLSDNLANADVAGFKAAQMSFAPVSDGTSGLGTVSTGRQTLFSQGKLMQSGGPFDLAIDGSGFFALRAPDGSTVYTRDGEFSRAADGSVRNHDGDTLTGVTIPSDATHVEVDVTGHVFVDTPAAQHVACGAIKIAIVPAPDQLRSLGGTRFAATRQSGSPHLVEPGGAHTAKLEFGMLERSNVSIITAMMDILAAQRAFEANSKGVQAADEMLRIANNIQRS